MRNVYLDHAATTPVDKRIFDVMEPYLTEEFGNPSAIYNLGRNAQKAVSDSRKNVAKLMHALPENIIFTGSGSESDNLAIYGVMKAHQGKGKHVISLSIEHHAVLRPLEDLAKSGFEVTYIPVKNDGLVDVDTVIKAIRSDTILVTIMYANNEMGAIQPIADIGREILKYRKTHNTPYPFFHSDACQASEYLDLDVEKLHVDLMTLNGSKVYGPKGVGVLYLRRGVQIKPMILGGGQEKGRRAGTENVPAIIGFAKALELAQKEKDKESSRLRALTEYFWRKIRENITDVRLNGPEIGENRLPNNLNITFLNIEGEAMLLYLDEYGIMCSTGSACTSESLEPSHVLRAMGMPYEMAHGSLRFTFGHSNSKADIDYVMKILPAIVAQLREISPVNMGRIKHAKFK
ncbi:MAG: aminotransferase class V-fold PLP-dependent enzyme [Candidatus Magasanikbacteria bacterium]|nr:aminotransferase class V-fold PLP-dependent enzyme [Candidatus Magasanikbacteria bacterium]